MQMDRYLSDGALNNSCELERNLVHLKAEVERKFKQIIPCYILIYCLDRYPYTHKAYNDWNEAILDVQMCCNLRSHESGKVFTEDNL